MGISEPSTLCCHQPSFPTGNLRCIHTLKGHHTEIVCVAFNVQARCFSLVLAWGFCREMFPKIERKGWLLQGGLGPQKPVMNRVKFHTTYRGPTTTCITGRWVRIWVISLTIPETNIALESLGLEEEFPFGKASSQVLC